MANNDAHYIFYAISHDGLVVARVEFGKIASGYQIRAGAVTDASSSTFTNLAWTTAVTSAWHKIEIEWKAATAPGANDGVLTLWIDGVQKATATNLDNDTRRVDGAQLGAVAGIDTGTRGTEYFDTFVSRRTTYIGLVAPGGIEVAKIPLPAQSQADNGIRMAAFTRPKQSTPVGDVLPVSLAPMLRPTGDLETHAIAYTYDPLNRLMSAYYADGSYFIYTYDAVGNRLTETTQAGTTTYTYDDANRLATVNGVAYTWDNNGNLLSDGTSTYTYDHANRLKSVTTGGTTYTYAYNGLGDRVSQTVGGVTTHYTLDLNAELTQVLADGTNTYLYGNERIAQYGAGGPEYFLGDSLGSVRQMVDGAGTITLTKSYEPFGDILNNEGTGTTVFGFNSEWADPTGLIYLRARYYVTGQGRFINHDSWGGDPQQPMSYNSWVYVYDNPINRIDPRGLFPCELADNGKCPDPKGPEKYPPYGITFTPYLDPLYRGAIGIPHGVNGAQYVNFTVKNQWRSKRTGGYPRSVNLCGQVSVAAILASVDPSITINEVLDSYEEEFNMSLNGSEETDVSDLMRFITKKYYDYLSIPNNYWYASDIIADLYSGSPDWTSEAGRKQTIERIQGYLSRGSVFIAGVLINGNTGELGLEYGAYHWVVVTGVSAKFDFDKPQFWSYFWIDKQGNSQGVSVHDYFSEKNWVRIYNPFDNETEYYRWSEFSKNWLKDQSTIMRIDRHPRWPRGLKGSC